VRRPPGQRPSGPRPAGPTDRSWQDRPRDDRPRDDRPRDDRPWRDRPPGPRRPFDRPPFDRRPDRGPARPFRPAPLRPPEELGPDEELIAGRRPVEEAFVARRPAIRLLVVPQRRGALEKLVLHATNLRIPIVEVEGGSLTALAGFDGHQGIALVVEPRQFASPDDILARAAERGEPPFILVLDSLEDPHNVGSLLRSAEAAGVHGVLFPTHRQAPLSPSAVKASAGAVEHLLLAPVDDLPGTLSDLHARGVRIAGSDGDAPLTARQTDLRGPIAIVVGSEGQGLGPAVRRRCDVFMRIPMKGSVGSLNAAVAGSILLFEALAQRDAAAPTPPPADAPKEPPKRRTRRPKAEARDTTSEASAPDTAAPEPAADDLLPPDATTKPAPKRRTRKVAAEGGEPGPEDTPHA
jgi:23S rRNA (guanosine2251-2'-O)-methyltransferase